MTIINNDSTIIIIIIIIIILFFNRHLCKVLIFVLLVFLVILDRFSTSENRLCNVFHDQARRHMSEVSVKFHITDVSSWHILHNVIRTARFSCNS